MISNRLSFAVYFPELPRPVEDVWETILVVLRKNQCLPKRFSMSQVAGHREEFHSRHDIVLSPEEVSKVINERELDGFRVDTGQSSGSINFHLADNKNAGGSSNLMIRIWPKTKTPPTWNDLIASLSVKWKIIDASQFNLLYEVWQNWPEVKFYEPTCGPLPPGLMRYTQPPRDAISGATEMIDVSLNPGRRKNLLWGVDFHPSAEMWLGAHFWHHAKCTKEEAMAAEFFLEVQDTPHFLYLKCWPHAFTRPDGEQGRMQQRLWKLFFHEDCEWPPGSGTICDEPMYGPPELMP